MKALNERRGTPLLGDYFNRIVHDDWVGRNPRIYRLYNIGEMLLGYWGVIPLSNQAFVDFRRGPRCPWRDIKASDIMTVAEFDAVLASHQPVSVWIESFTVADEHSFRIVGHDLLDYLRKLNLQGLVVESSCPQSEDNCRFLGLECLREYDRCPTGIRKIWAIPAAALKNPEWPFGPPAQSLALSGAQRRVAREFYLKWDKQGPPTEEQVARNLGLRANTIKGHLKRVRSRADEVLGIRERDRLSLWLHLHPSEVE